MRPLPEITPENAAFWSGGERGELMIACCDDCQAAIHPPQIVCPHCLSRNVAPRAMPGTGTGLYLYGQPPAMAARDGRSVRADGGRCRWRARGAGDGRSRRPGPQAVRIGQRMQIGFEQVGGVWFPQWRPLDAEAGR